MVPTLVPRLSTIRVLMPHLAIQFAIINPAGPAPMMRTSTSESAWRGAIAAGWGCWSALLGIGSSRRVIKGEVER